MDNNKDIRQLQEDLIQEKEDNKVNPEEKRAALEMIIKDYNEQYGTNHIIGEFDSYYQDVQKRIKDQQYPNRDFPHSQKIDIIIVVDMLLTGFDSKFLNTLYVDKNLKHHGLIQAFSRTNRILNDTKPYGNILEFRGQEAAVNEAIKMFSGKQEDGAKEIWLVDKAPVVIEKLQEAMQNLNAFMRSQGLENKPENVSHLKGDIARGQFIKCFKEVQKLKTQLDQYTDLGDEDKARIESILPREELQKFKGVYLETAFALKDKQKKDADKIPEEVEQLDFEFVLFSSVIIDYDYIMKLLERYSAQSPDKVEITKQQLVDLLKSEAKFHNEVNDIKEYINRLTMGEGLSEKQIRDGYEAFKIQENQKEVRKIAEKHGLQAEDLQRFTDQIIMRNRFDGEELRDLLQPLGLGWKDRAKKELALMEDLIPLLHKRANGKEIAGLKVYE